MQITNTTRQSIALPKKDGTFADLRGDETATITGLDTESAAYKGAVFAGAIVEGKAKPIATPPSADTRTRASKPE